MKYNVYKYPSKSQWLTLVKRPEYLTEDLEEINADIFLEIRNNGDAAVLAYTRKFDKVELKIFTVEADEFEFAAQQVPDDLKNAIDQAFANITAFHKDQLTVEPAVETMPGVRCWRETRPIQKVGLYIPGGTAPLFSTVLMLGIPAMLAGCGETVLCTPPQADGTVHPAVLYGAQLCGITKIIKAGGAQAIAALTFGTETVPAVDKIFGPGNRFVTEAKVYAQKYGVAIDLPAGPSEVLIIADQTANADFCAADLLSQAEHGADSQVIFVCTDEKVLDETLSKLDQQIELLPRAEIAHQALQESRFVLLESLEEAIKISNLYAPEHLILALEKPLDILSQVTNAGSIFLGNYTPESAGDYASGTNHTLPTAGFAKNYSGVSTDSFIKKITVQQITPQGLQLLGPAVELMAAAEGLQGHKNAITVRLNQLNNEI